MCVPLNAASKLLRTTGPERTVEGQPHLVFSTPRTVSRAHYYARPHAFQAQISHAVL